MNRQDYRKAFDAISFSEDFAPRTQALLLKAKQQAAEKEKKGRRIVQAQTMGMRGAVMKTSQHRI